MSTLFSRLASPVNVRILTWFHYVQLHKLSRTIGYYASEPQLDLLPVPTSLVEHTLTSILSLIHLPERLTNKA